MNEQMSLFDYQPEDDSKTIDLKQNLKAIELDRDAPNARLVDLVPEKASLALTRGYIVRSVHVSRILVLLEEVFQEGATVTREEVGERLSMPWASAQSYLNVMRRMMLVNAKTNITPFGRLVMHRSPYVDNIELLWLLHYLLASNANLVLWSNLFNLAFYGEDEISKQEVSDSFHVLNGRWSEKSLEEKVPNELRAILRTYTEELFASLRIVASLDDDNYECYWNAALISPLIWLACIYVYRGRYYPGASSLEVPLLIHANYSPGRILRQNEVAARRALDELHKAGLLTVETRSGLDQVRFKREWNWLTTAAEFLQSDQ